MAREKRASANGPGAFQVCPEKAFVVADSHCSVQPDHGIALRDTPLGNVARS